MISELRTRITTWMASMVAPVISSPSAPPARWSKPHTWSGTASPPTTALTRPYHKASTSSCVTTAGLTSSHSTMSWSVYKLYKLWNYYLIISCVYYFCAFVGPKLHGRFLAQFEGKNRPTLGKISLTLETKEKRSLLVQLKEVVLM